MRALTETRVCLTLERDASCRIPACTPVPATLDVAQDWPWGRGAGFRGLGFRDFGFFFSV